MSLITALHARLSSVAALKLVGGAADFQAAAETNPLATPAAYVVLLDERPGQNPRLTGVLQQVEVAIGVAIVVRNVADKKGATGLDALDPIRAAVRGALLGYTPLTGYARLTRGQGSLLAFRDGHLWWQDMYHSSYYDQAA